jgi:hypothetical protein
MSGLKSPPRLVFSSVYSLFEWQMADQRDATQAAVSSDLFLALSEAKISATTVMVNTVTEFHN